VSRSILGTTFREISGYSSPWWSELQGSRNVDIPRMNLDTKKPAKRIIFNFYWVYGAVSDAYAEVDTLWNTAVLSESFIMRHLYSFTLYSFFYGFVWNIVHSHILYQHIFVNKVPIGYIGPKIRGIKRSNGRFNITKISNTNYQIWKYKVKLLLIWEDLWYTINMVDLNNRMRNNLKRTGTCYDRPISWIWSIKIH